MKNAKILLVDADGDCAELVSSVAAQDGRGVRWVKTSREAFHILGQQLRKVEVVIVDVDPGVHGIALLEAISGCAERPPMIVLTALEETYMKPIATNHGATACLGKPVSATRLREAFHQLERHAHLTSDSWGHPAVPHTDHAREVKSAARGIAHKLSPHTGAARRRASDEISESEESCWPIATIRQEMTEL